MEYLKIENPGYSSTEFFTLMGASATREASSQETIGMFGSGFKHGITCFLREGQEVYVFVNKLQLHFYVEAVRVTDNISAPRDLQRVCMDIKGTDDKSKQYNKTEKLGWTLGYGADTWTSLNMALREFVSNCFDRTVLQNRAKNTSTESVIELVEEKSVRAKAGTTRIFVAAIPPVMQYYKNLDKHFLHRRQLNKVEGVLVKADRSLNGSEQAMCYKKGVLVRQCSTFKKPSLFDYNFGNELQLDECRNASEGTMQYYAAKRVFNAAEGVCTRMLDSLVKGEETWESTFDEMCLLSQIEGQEECFAKWSNIFKKQHGHLAVIAPALFSMHDLVVRKGYKPIIVAQTGWFNALEKAGILTFKTVLNQDEMNGVTYHEVNDVVVNLVNEVWSKLLSVNMTSKKPKPQVSVFTKTVSAGSRLLGYYKDGIIYINQEITQGANKLLFNTILEEIAHYVTGATDNSRDFQEWYMSVIAEIWFPTIKS